MTELTRAVVATRGEDFFQLVPINKVTSDVTVWKLRVLTQAASEQWRTDWHSDSVCQRNRDHVAHWASYSNAMHAATAALLSVHDNHRSTLASQNTASTGRMWTAGVCWWLLFTLARRVRLKLTKGQNPVVMQWLCPFCGLLSIFVGKSKHTRLDPNASKVQNNAVY